MYLKELRLLYMRIIQLNWPDTARLGGNPTSIMTRAPLALRDASESRGGTWCQKQGPSSYPQPSWGCGQLPCEAHRTDLKPTSPCFKPHVRCRHFYWGVKKKFLREFLGCPVVRTLHFHHRGHRFAPWWILHAVWCDPGRSHMACSVYCGKKKKKSVHHKRKKNFCSYVWWWL